MKHLKEEELIAYCEGVAEQRTAISEHLAACEESRGELQRIDAVLAALHTLPVSEPGAEYGRQAGAVVASLARTPAARSGRRGYGSDCRGVRRWAVHKAGCYG